MKDPISAFLAGMMVASILVCVFVAFTNVMKQGIVNYDCQSLGFSAGHYEREAGLVCEQWIEAAKVRP